MLYAISILAKCIKFACFRRRNSSGYVLLRIMSMDLGMKKEKFFSFLFFSFFFVFFFVF